jgi:hypothetical protein
MAVCRVRSDAGACFQKKAAGEGAAVEGKPEATADADGPADGDPSTAKDPGAAAERITKAQNLVAEGRQLMKSRSLYKAQEKFEAAIELTPKGWLPRFLLGVAFEKIYDLDHTDYTPLAKAVGSYSQGTSSPPPSSGSRRQSLLPRVRRCVTSAR